MSIPAHIWLTDENNSPLIGECLMPTRLGSTELKSFNHSVWIPADHNTGKLTGTRLHVPVKFEKKLIASHQFYSGVYARVESLKRR